MGTLFGKCLVDLRLYSISCYSFRCGSLWYSFELCWVWWMLVWGPIYSLEHYNKVLQTGRLNHGVEVRSPKACRLQVHAVELPGKTPWERNSFLSFYLPVLVVFAGYFLLCSVVHRPSLFWFVAWCSIIEYLSSQKFQTFIRTLIAAINHNGLVLTWMNST